MKTQWHGVKSLHIWFWQNIDIQCKFNDQDINPNFSFFENSQQGENVPGVSIVGSCYFNYNGIKIEIFNLFKSRCVPNTPMYNPNPV